MPMFRFLPKQASCSLAVSLVMMMGIIPVPGLAQSGTGSSTSAAAMERSTTCPIVRKLTPLSIRGVNYYPSRYSWGEFWGATPAEVIEQDMALAASLNMNTVRIFINWGESAERYRLIDREGNVSPVYLKKFEDLLATAWKHGIRVIACFELERRNPSLEMPPREQWQRAMKAFVEPHVTDGRILMWDLMNEPERHDWSPGARQYLKESMVFLRQLDPEHLITVGIAYQVDKLSETVLPDVMQYHEYSPRKELEKMGPARIKRSIDAMRAAGGERPVFIGEFGISTGKDPVYGAGEEWIRTKGASSKAETEAEQLWRYQQILKAAEQEQIAGVVAWCLHEYPTEETGWLTPDESQFGLVRLDGSLKPAAVFLRDTFGEWAASQDERHSHGPVLEDLWLIGGLFSTAVHPDRGELSPLLAKWNEVEREFAGFSGQ